MNTGKPITDESPRETLQQLTVGTKLQVSLPDDPTPLESRFIGLQFRQYILITPPVSPDKKKPPTAQGTPLTIRYLMNGRIIAFVGRIMDSLNAPASVLILSWPPGLFEHRLRKNRRISCAIPGGIIARGQHKQGVLFDISLNGCGIVSHYKETDTEIILSKKEIADFTFKIPGIPKDMQINGEIRKIRQIKQEVRYGVMFQTLSSDTRNAIDAYIRSVTPV